MDIQQIKIIETIVVIVTSIGLRFLVTNLLTRIAVSFDFESRRRKMISKVINLSLYVLVILILLGIWGVDKNRVAIYLSSTLAILGVAFVAQWSHLSNITASVILYFSHPVKIGDSITIKDKDLPVDGRISDIGLFFVTIKTEQGEKIMISSTLFLQKIVQIAEEKKVEN
ncbi:MAG: mechanosensitive ion channel [Saprospiraceae bacterium]|nr:mechanosensitive ion channel [Saprospiraceae bacterium]